MKQILKDFIEEDLQTWDLSDLIDYLLEFIFGRTTVSEEIPKWDKLYSKYIKTQNIKKSDLKLMNNSCCKKCTK